MNETGNARQAADDVAVLVGEGVDDAAAEPGPEVPREAITENDAPIVGRVEQRPLRDGLEDRQRLGALHRGVVGDEAGAVAVRRRRQHRLADDAWQHAAHVVELGQALDLSLGSLHGATQRWLVVVVGVLHGDVPAADAGRRVDHLLPAAVVHADDQHGQEEGEGDGEGGDERAPLAPPQVLPRHSRQIERPHVYAVSVPLIGGASPPRGGSARPCWRGRAPRARRPAASSRWAARTPEG